jgi:hypothetical protein
VRPDLEVLMAPLGGAAGEQSGTEQHAQRRALLDTRRQIAKTVERVVDILAPVAHEHHRQHLAWS